MKTIHVIGVDHDGSAGQAACAGDEAIGRFLAKLVSDADLVYIGNDSLRQDTYLDLKNIILRATWLERSRRVTLRKGETIRSHIQTNGSIYQSGKILKRMLLKHAPGLAVAVLKTMTPVIFSNQEDMFAFIKQYKAIHQLTEDELRWFKRDDRRISAWLKRNIKQTTYYDKSKFLSIWLKIQEVSLRHPDADITYHFLDDKQELGAKLYVLFQYHPELLPANVKFTFHRCIYSTSKQSLSTKAYRFGKKPLQGEGVAHPNYKQRLLKLTRRALRLANSARTFYACNYLFEHHEHLKELIGQIRSNSVKTRRRAAASAPPSPSAAQPCLFLSDKPLQCFEEGDEATVHAQLQEGCRLM